MEVTPHLNSQPKVAARSGLGQTSIGRILRKEAGATVDSLDLIARAFGIEPWHLLVPNFDPARLPKSLTLADREYELLEKMRVAAQEFAEYQVFSNNK
jgi:transcriptional regulator with XRE-family HTH domain